MRPITSSALSPRSSSGLSCTNIRPALAAPLELPDPPVNAITLSTASSALTIDANCVSSLLIDWNDVSWSAWIAPVKRPVSCCGKKPLGTITYR